MSTGGPRAMRAAVYDRYGGPEVVRIEEVPVPSPAAGQVLVRVAATSVNLSDWECLRGSPLYARLGGLRAPAVRTLGSDIAGWVEAVGPDVTGFAVGDEVYGDNLASKGGFAEYAIAPGAVLAPKPAGLSFIEGSGSFAIQLAKRAGARVTATTRPSSSSCARSAPTR